MGVSDITQMVTTVVGGLGIFLLGMKNMSEGMQAVAGASLRRMISAVTNNRLLATAVGTIVTCIVQSSSITTVMVVGFVNSGVMQLTQAVGVIMGANIGTTITGWILVLDIGKYGLPMLGLAAFVYLFSRGDRYRYWAMFIMGLGMVFFGLELMKDACARIKDMPEFEAWFQQFQATSYFGVLKCAMVGCLVTMVVQSSSATLGITISLASQGIISYETAAALVLGENIGTTITAFLASLGTTTNARRAAYFHVMFNMLGVFWITLIFSWYIQFIPWLLAVPVNEAVIVQKDGIAQTIYPYTTPAIAATHTVFNVANTVLFLPFLPVFVKILERVVPSKPFKEKPHLTDLDIRMLDTPLLALEQSRKELLKMGDGCRKMMDWLKTLLTADEPTTALADRMKRREEVLDRIQEEVAQFITTLLSGNVPHAVAQEAGQQLRIAHEYEAISDYLLNILKFDQRLRKEGHRFTPRQLEDLVKMHDAIGVYVQEVHAAQEHQDTGILTKLDTKRKHLRQKIKKCRQEHLDELSRESIPPQVSIAFMTTLNAYSRVRDHAQNVAEAIAGEI